VDFAVGDLEKPFMLVLDEMLTGGLVTLEGAELIAFRSARATGDSPVARSTGSSGEP
jgi:hypothetical protein